MNERERIILNVVIQKKNIECGIQTVTVLTAATTTFFFFFA